MARTKGSRGGRRSKAAASDSSQAGVPTVYHEMLADTVSSPTHLNDEGHTIKKRRIAGRVVTQNQKNAISVPSDQGLNSANESILEEPASYTKAFKQQISFQDSEDSSESDMDWEEVDIADNSLQANTLENDIVTTGDLNIVIGGDDYANQSKNVFQRRPMTSAEKKQRLEIHKMHLLTLMIHVHSRNHWCNDENVHEALNNFLSSRTASYLDPSETNSQFQRSRSFIDGLSQAGEEFRKKFKIVARGMSRPYWAENAEALASVNMPEDLELPLQVSDFRLIASELEGSRDVGAQIFCALLRSVGVDARLVCSLQPLPFIAASKGLRPQKPTSMTVVADPENLTASSNEEREVDLQMKPSPSVLKPIGSIGGRSRFSSNPTTKLGLPVQSSMAGGPTPSVLPFSRPKRIKESPFPVYWIEAFNEAVQKWIPVDPLITETVSKPSKFEPPASDSQNHLSYVLAFEDDGSARDVTRRYAKAYNAKTRRARVEATKGGENWWRRILKIYRRSYELPRDQVEDAELAAREAAEEMPRNVMDFKDHPYYALERHLKRGEVIHPKREVGKVGAGRGGGKQVLEPIFRRRDVHVVKSADSWYRQGREIKVGEQPLKHVAARRGGKESKLEDDDRQSGEEEANPGTALYAAYQTTAYTAPPVVHGRIPKNVYGNLDIYVPSMVPPGGTHILHAETARAARILGIDYADAVTGFAFKGRHGTAVITGAVVATTCREAVEDVILGLEDEATQQEEVRRSAEVLRLWRRFLKGLRIRARIEGYEIEGERAAVDERRLKEADEEEDDEHEAGGFLPDAESRTSVEPTAGRDTEKHSESKKSSEEYREDEGGGVLPDEEDSGDDGDGVEGGGFMAWDEGEEGEEGEDSINHADKHRRKNFDRRALDLDNHDEGGGFLRGRHVDDLLSAKAQKGFIADKGLERVENDEENAKFYVERKGITKGSGKEEHSQSHTTDRKSWQSQDNPAEFLHSHDQEIPTLQARNTAIQQKSTPLASHPDFADDDELAEALMLQQVHENENKASSSSAHFHVPAVDEPLGLVSEGPETALGSSFDPDGRGWEARNRDGDEEVVVVGEGDEAWGDGGGVGTESEAGERSEEGLGGSVRPESEAGESSEEGAGSLLSHDPEDEDADPEWLA